MNEKRRLQRSGSWLLTTGLTGLVGVTLALSPRAAEAKIVSAFLEAQGSAGGVNNDGGGEHDTAQFGAGGKLGLEVLVFQIYGEHTFWTGDASLSKGVLGLRGDVGLGKWRLLLHGGGGVVRERGGVLGGAGADGDDRSGVLAVVGASFDRKIAPLLFGGLGLEAQAFRLGDGFSFDRDEDVTGSSIMANLHLTFEIGL